MNPTVKEFLEKYPDKTMFGFMWAIIWRFWVAYFAVVMAIVVAFTTLDVIFS